MRTSPVDLTIRRESGELVMSVSKSEILFSKANFLVESQANPIRSSSFESNNELKPEIDINSSVLI
ncbi:MAG: hypothetical protein ACI9UV_001443 [Algoriphagus sp.]|jgi:hypothetical protein|tara:strand:+ start:819 stop:1016 length:198 start_codon:yes stop_codon:yes gene_type:complete